MGCSSLISKLFFALPLLFLFTVIGSHNAYSQEVCAGYALNMGNGNVTQEGPVGVINSPATANQSGMCSNNDNIATFDGPPFDPPTTQTASSFTRWQRWIQAENSEETEPSHGGMACFVQSFTKCLPSAS